MARRSTTPAPAPGGPRSRSRSRTPVPVRTRRTAGDVLKAFCAFVALAALVLGVPLALAYFIGWPLPHGMPSWNMLRDEVSAGVFVKVLTVVVWLAWAQFTACVLVETKAALSGVGLPARVPGAGPSQLLARQLVAALLLLGAGTGSFAPGLSQLGHTPLQPYHPDRTVAAAQLTPGQQQAVPGTAHADSAGLSTMGGSDSGSDAVLAAGDTGRTGTADRTPAPGDTARTGRSDQAGREAGTKFYRIQPPEGRHHDSLWEVAERHLGDGRRYKEIYRLNKDRVQPDGSRLSEASLIRPGWIMEMPADAYGGELVEMPDEADRLDARERARIERYQAGGGDRDGAGHDGAGQHAGGQDAGGRDGVGRDGTGRDGTGKGDGAHGDGGAHGDRDRREEPSRPDASAGDEPSSDRPAIPGESDPGPDTSAPDRPTTPDGSDGGDHGSPGTDEGGDVPEERPSVPEEQPSVPDSGPGVPGNDETARPPMLSDHDTAGGGKGGSSPDADAGADADAPGADADADAPDADPDADDPGETVDVAPGEHTPDRQAQSVPERPAHHPTRPDGTRDGADDGGPAGVGRPGELRPDTSGDAGSPHAPHDPATRAPATPDTDSRDSGHQGSGHHDSGHQGSATSGDDRHGGDRHGGDTQESEGRNSGGRDSDRSGSGPQDTGAGHSSRADGDGGDGDGGDSGRRDTKESSTGLDSADASGGDRAHEPGRPAGAQRADEGALGPVGLPEALLGAPLLAAGVLAALGSRRRAALWRAVGGGARRAPGDDFAPPSDPAARARDALLAGADPDAVRFLDHALRGLAQDLRAAGRPLPVVYAAWLTGQDLHLQLAEETEEPPAPWRYGQNRSFWTVQRADLRGEVDTEAAPPYPGLVCLGLRGEARLLLNLESVPGLVSVAGDPELRDAVLASVAAELATGSWSQVTGITLVGFGAELTVLAPGRMRHLPDVATLLREREAAGRGIAGREAVGRAGADTEGAGAWRSAPSQVVLVGAEPTGEEARRLAALAEGDGPAVGFVVGVSEGRLPMPSVVWEFRIEEDGTLAADRMGLAVRAQLLPAPLRAAVVELFADTDDVHTEGSRGPGFRVDLSAGGRPAVYARLMGRYEVVGVEPPEESRSAALHEALALLLLNRDGVHPRVLASALWPKGVGDDVRDALVARLRDWLGTDPDGTHRLTTGEDGRLALRPSVVSDWDVLRTLHHGCTGERGAKLAARLRRRQLADALELARGPLLADRPEGRYGWLAHDVAEAQHPLLVAEVGLALAAEHLRAQDPAAAVGAVRAALRSAPADERLWDELVRAAHATGDADTLDEAVRAVVRYAAELHGPARGVPPRTRALLDELAPHWARLAGA